VAISKESIVGGVIFWCAARPAAVQLAAACVHARNALTRASCLFCARRIALLLPVGIFVFKNAEEGEGPPQ
jgi:hypothetical protein